MNLQDLKTDLQNAIDQVSDAQQQVEEIMERAGFSTSHYNAYGKYGFDQLQGNGNRYDSTLYSIMDKLEKMEKWEETEMEKEADLQIMTDRNNA